MYKSGLMWNSRPWSPSPGSEAFVRRPSIWTCRRQRLATPSPVSRTALAFASSTARPATSLSPVLAANTSRQSRQLCQISATPPGQLPITAANRQAPYGSVARSPGGRQLQMPFVFEYLRRYSEMKVNLRNPPLTDPDRKSRAAPLPICTTSLCLTCRRRFRFSAQCPVL
jgi:hypothetical protein